MTQLGMGCAHIGQTYNDVEWPKEVCVDFLRHVADQGIRFFDTALTYGNSFEWVLEALGGYDVTLCCKYPQGQDVRILADRWPEVDVWMSHNFVDGYARLEERDLGASVYSPAQVNRAFGLGRKWVQFPFNIINSENRNAFRHPGNRIVRSVFLRGKLASMAEDAFRYVLNFNPEIVLVGIETVPQLQELRQWLEKGPKSWGEIVDPRKWDV